jgi:hypothetical protein
VSETDVVEWCDAAAQAYLLGDGQTITSTIVKARNELCVCCDRWVDDPLAP